MGWLDTIKDYAVPDFVEEEIARSRQNSKNAKALEMARRAREATLRARQARVALTGQGGLSVYRAPTIADEYYDKAGRGVAAVNRAFGVDEHKAAQRGQSFRDNLSDVVETVRGPAAVEHSIRNIARGEGGVGDYAVTALEAVPFLPEPVRLGAGRVAGAIARGVAEHTPQAVRNAVDHLLPTGAIKDATSFTHGGNDILYPDHPQPSLKVAGAPEPRAPMPGPRVTSVVPYRDALPPRAVQPQLPAAAARPLLTHVPAYQPNSAEHKPKGGNWFPDAALDKNPFDEGWTLHDRGDHAHPNVRFQVVAPGGRSAQVFPSEEQALDYARINAGSANLSPEYAARSAAWDVDPEGIHNDDTSHAAREWLKRSLAKYYKTDFGTNRDPIMDLIRADKHWDPTMTTDKWRDVVNSSLGEDPLNYFTVPKHGLPKGQIEYESPMGAQMLEKAPGLARATPVTAPIYSLTSAPDLGDEFYEELPKLFDPASPLPPHLKVDVSKLDKMSFPAIAKKVGDAAEYTREQKRLLGLSSFDHPAVDILSQHDELAGPWRPGEKPRFNATWAELRPPPLTAELDDPLTAQIIAKREAEGDPIDPRAVEASRKVAQRQKLDEQLKYEGDKAQQNICVGQDMHGYCDKVMDGRGRIFSLRDQHGKPRVTIETGKRGSMWEEHGSAAIPDETDLADIWNGYRYGDAVTTDPTHPSNASIMADPRDHDFGVDLGPFEPVDFNMTDDELAAALAQPVADRPISGATPPSLAVPYRNPRWNDFEHYLQDQHPETYAANKAKLFDPQPDEIVQVKGYDNTRPGSQEEEFKRPPTAVELDPQPYISDFIKRGQYSTLGDAGHTNLLQVPNPGQAHQRYIDKGDVAKVLGDLPGDVEFGPGSRHYWQDVLDNPGSIRTSGASRLREHWPELEPFFKGYAKGGPVRVDPKLVKRARKRYPFLDQYDPQVVPGEGEGWSEAFPPGEEGTEDYPRPKAVPMNRFGVEVYNPRFGPDDLAGEMMHFDPRAQSVREGLLATMSDEQLAALRHGSADYQMTMDRGQGEASAMRNAADSAVRGFAVGQWPPEAIAQMKFNSGQRKALDDLRVYMTGER